MDKGNKLRLVGVISEILGKERLHELGFNIPVDGKVTAGQAVMLNRAPRDYGECSEKHRKPY